MIWITREHVHVDRVACPWLIKRFIDPEAQFLFFPKEKVMEFAKTTGGIPFDTPGAELHHYERDGIQHCSFDSLVEKYLKTQVENDEALQKLRKIIRAADTGNLDVPIAMGIEAIASGTSLIVDTDHEALNVQFPFYDAVYAYLQGEMIINKYKSEIEKIKSRGERNAYIKNKIRELSKT